MRKRWQAHMGRGEHIDNLQDWLKTNNCFLPDDMNESDWTSLAMCLGKEAREAIMPIVNMARRGERARIVRLLEEGL